MYFVFFCVNFRSRRKSNRPNGRPDYHESDESNQSQRNAMPNRQHQYIVTEGDTDIIPIASSVRPSTDDKWWRDYLNRKLDLETQKMQNEDEYRRDLLKLRRQEILSKEKHDKLKVDAIVSLTEAIAKYAGGAKHLENGIDALAD